MIGRNWQSSSAPAASWEGRGSSNLSSLFEDDIIFHKTQVRYIRINFFQKKGRGRIKKAKTVARGKHKSQKV